MRRVLSFAALSLIAIASTASAQRSTRGSVTSANPSPELGVDAGLQFTLDSPRTTSFEGGGSLTTYGVGLGMLYHFSTSRAAKQMYVRPFIGLDGFSGSGNSDSAFNFGGGFGVKVPVGDRFASRFEANLSHASNNGASQNAIGLLAGLSVYTH